MEKINNTISSEKKEKKVLVPDTSKLLVRIIEDDTNILHIALGITDKRAHELQDIVNKEKIGSTGMSDLLTKVSVHAIHANELAYMAYALGTFYKQQSDPLEGFLSQYFKR